MLSQQNSEFLIHRSQFCTDLGVPVAGGALLKMGDELALLLANVRTAFVLAGGSEARSSSSSFSLSFSSYNTST